LPTQARASQSRELAISATARRAVDTIAWVFGAEAVARFPLSASGCLHGVVTAGRAAPSVLGQKRPAGQARRWSHARSAMGTLSEVTFLARSVGSRGKTPSCDVEWPHLAGRAGWVMLVPLDRYLLKAGGCRWSALGRQASGAANERLDRCREPRGGGNRSRHRPVPGGQVFDTRLGIG
jgi:hypothetical protein